MAIVQENRFDAPQPEVSETEYGAQYVKAATETPVPEAPQVSEQPAEEVKEEEAPKAKARKGRPRKAK